MGPAVLCGSLTLLWSLFSAPCVCCAVNRERTTGGEPTYCRNNSTGLLLGCNQVRSHKLQKLTTRLWWFSFLQRRGWHELWSRLFGLDRNDQWTAGHRRRGDRRQPLAVRTPGVRNQRFCVPQGDADARAPGMTTPEERGVSVLRTIRARRAHFQTSLNLIRGALDLAWSNVTLTEAMSALSTSSTSPMG